jgi:phosphoribosylformylglycinamidine (FGAM) synthase-like amidotransferase family enzyme
MPATHPGSSYVLPSHRQVAAGISRLMDAIAASEIVVGGETAFVAVLAERAEACAELTGFNALMSAGGDVDGDVLRWIASHVKPKKRLSAH